MEDFWKVFAGLVGGGAFVGLGAWLLKLLNTRHGHKREDRKDDREERKDTLQDAFDLIDKLRVDVDKAERKADQALDGERRCEKRLARRDEYLEYVVYECQKAGIPLRAFKEDTDTHDALPDRRKGDDPERAGPDRRKPKRGGP